MAKKHGPLCICDRCTTTPRMAEMKRDRKRKLRDIGTTAGFVAGVALTGGQAYDDPAQNGQNTQGNYAQSERDNRRTNQARGHRRNTTYKGKQRGGSSQNG